MLNNSTKTKSPDNWIYEYDKKLSCIDDTIYNGQVNSALFWDYQTKDDYTNCLQKAWQCDIAKCPLTNAECFNGCTYEEACADIRNYTPSCATNAECFAGLTCTEWQTYIDEHSGGDLPYYIQEKMICFCDSVLTSNTIRIQNDITCNCSCSCGVYNYVQDNYCRFYGSYNYTPYNHCQYYGSYNYAPYNFCCYTGNYNNALYNHCYYYGNYNYALYNCCCFYGNYNKADINCCFFYGNYTFATNNCNIFYGNYNNVTNNYGHFYGSYNCVNYCNNGCFTGVYNGNRRDNNGYSVGLENVLYGACATGILSCAVSSCQSSELLFDKTCNNCAIFRMCTTTENSYIQLTINNNIWTFCCDGNLYKNGVCVL